MRSVSTDISARRIPSAVKAIERPRRTNRATPINPSISLILLDTAPGVNPSSLAAREKLLWRAAASNTGRHESICE
ncbi:MAG: hypothetical protein QM488_18310 [Rhizobiaceae bacterium]